MFDNPIDFDTIISDEHYFRSCKLGAIFVAVAAFLCSIALNVTFETTYDTPLFFSGLAFFWIGIYFFSYTLGRWPNFTSIFLLFAVFVGSASLWSLSLDAFSTNVDPISPFEMNRDFVCAVYQITALLPVYAGYKKGRDKRKGKNVESRK